MFARNSLITLSTLALTIAFQAAQATPTSYTFTVDSNNSLWKSGLGFSAAIGGNFTGSYSATNKSGTQTKPGSNGTFATGENDPIPVSGAIGCEAGINTAFSGSFGLSVDTSANTVTLSNLNIATGSSPVKWSQLEFGFKTAAFQTQSPTFSYPASSRTSGKFDEVTVSSITVSQASDGSGKLKLLSGSTYEFNATYVATLKFVVVSQLQTKLITKTVPLIFSGKLTLDGKNAHLVSSVAGSGKTIALTGPLALPTLGFDLPAGKTAKGSFLANLSVTTMVLDIAHAGTLIADGVSN